MREELQRMKLRLKEENEALLHLIDKLNPHMKEQLTKPEHNKSKTIKT